MAAPFDGRFPDAPFALDFQPGVQRDGTKFDAKRFIDMLWCRFRLGRPRKMGGYIEVFDRIAAIPRRVHLFYQGNLVYCHIGHGNGITQVVIDQNGNFISSADRTPPGFPANIATGWTIDQLFDTTGSGTNFIIAHPSQDVLFLPSTAAQVPYFGQIDAQTPLGAVAQPANLSGGTYTAPAVSGGIVVAQPYVFAFDSNGRILWSAPNNVNTLGISLGTSGAGIARVSAQKFVAGYPLRGGGANSPAAIFWSLSELISATFVGGTAVFAFNTISPSSSILSSRCVVEYDNLYFWAGVGRFHVYNGVLNELTNTQNQDWFFDNLNWAYASKTFAMKIPRWGEIWFCAPMFGNSEPSHAAIFNVRENYWYDTALPEGGRSAGFYPQGLRFPIMTGVTPDPVTGQYRLWVHENGVDALTDNGETITPLRSYFETGYFGGPTNQQPDDRGVSVSLLEPDILQQGDMSAYLISTPNARGVEQNGASVPIVLVPKVPQEQLLAFEKNKSTSRLFRLHVESNVRGGNYICGRHLMHAEPADARRVG